MIELWGPEPFLARLHEVVEIYAAVWGRGAEGQREISARHATYPDFASAAALDGERLVGFAYGSAGRPGQWWHDRVAPAAEAAGDGDWFADYFGVAELAVRPDAQGRGLGRALMERLLTAPSVQRHPRVVLMVDEGNNRALDLYRSLAFDDILADFRLFPGGPAKRVLGVWRGQASTAEPVR